MDAAPLHTTVLLTEAVDALLAAPSPTHKHPLDGLYVDATFGRGGHTRELLARLSPTGRVLAFDRDPEAVAQSASITDTRLLSAKKASRTSATWPMPAQTAF